MSAQISTHRHLGTPRRLLIAWCALAGAYLAFVLILLSFQAFSNGSVSGITFSPLSPMTIFLTVSLALILALRPWSSRQP
jgi:hypothetical protein